MSPTKYITDHGSEVTVYDNGRIVINLDWFEEPEACIECTPEADLIDKWLIFSCNECNGGSAKLKLKD